MNWTDVKVRMIAGIGEDLYPHGYRYIKSQESFERTTGIEARFVFSGFLAKKDALHKMRMWCGIRNTEVEHVFHRTSGVAKHYRRNYTVVNVAMVNYLDLETPDSIAAVKEETHRFLSEVALPFLSREYTLRDYSEMLNDNPYERCPFHANRENRCHYGLICAKLSGDPRYNQVKDAYSVYLKGTNNGFYYPRFQRLVADLENKET